MAALMALIMSSCSSFKPEPIPFRSSVYYLDYYKLGRNGKILLSESNSYSGEYQSIGSIIVDQKSGHVNIEVETTKKIVNAKPMPGDEIYGTQPEYKTETKYKTGDFKYATFSTALEEAVNTAEKMGGDAIINLKYEYRGPDGVSVSGMVIKRK